MPDFASLVEPNWTVSSFLFSTAALNIQIKDRLNIFYMSEKEKYVVFFDVSFGCHHTRNFFYFRFISKNSQPFLHFNYRKHVDVMILPDLCLGNS